MTRAVATIGVYGWTVERFIDALHGADVKLIVDVRQRRGVRGSEYSWAARSVGVVTALIPMLGYALASEVAAAALAGRGDVRNLALATGSIAAEELDRLSTRRR